MPRVARFLFVEATDMPRQKQVVLAPSEHQPTLYELGYERGYSAGYSRGRIDVLNPASAEPEYDEKEKALAHAAAKNAPAMGPKDYNKVAGLNAMSSDPPQEKEKGKRKRKARGESALPSSRLPSRNAGALGLTFVPRACACACNAAPKT